MIEPLIGHGPRPEEVHTFTVHFFINLIEILLNDLVTTIQDNIFSCFHQSFQEYIYIYIRVFLHFSQLYLQLASKKLIIQYKN